MILFFTTACTRQADVGPLNAPTLAGLLQPYATPSPSTTPIPATPIPTQTPLPTVTPHVYVVKSGETMGSIALKYGLDMGDLINANPDVSPSAMSIGQELLIPDTKAAINIPAVDPLDLRLADPDCYSTLNGGMWCFVLVENNTEGLVEGISVSVQIYNSAGKLLLTEIAFPLLDRLPVGEMTPALIYFQNIPTDIQVFANLKTAFEGNPDSDQYANVNLQGIFTQIAWDGKSARVRGDVIISQREVDRVWVVATAFHGEKVVGVRRWESDLGEKEFDFTVASLGPAIERVHLSVEAYP